MKKRYRLLTGTDDAAFCQRVSDALDDGYVLYGNPVMTVNDGHVIVGQGLILAADAVTSESDNNVL